MKVHLFGQIRRILCPLLAGSAFRSKVEFARNPIRSMPSGVRHAIDGRTPRLALGVVLSLVPFGDVDLSAAEADYSKPKETVIPLVEKGPVIDGKLDDECWSQASRATNFLTLERLKKTVSEQTEVLLSRDKENLYFGFTCRCADPSKILATKEKAGHDPSRLYKDDVVEIYIDPALSRHDNYHWIVNAKGAVWDAECHRLPETETMISSPQWDSHAEAAGSVGDKAWFVEVRIPLADFQPQDLKPLKEGKTWGIQFGRENWRVPEGEFSTWSASYKFTEPKDFGIARFSGAPVKEVAAAWEQKKADDLFQMDPPKRFSHQFTRLFKFGPAPQAAVADGKPTGLPDGASLVGAATVYSKEKGYGFASVDGVEEKAGGKISYGKGSSPLASGYLRSTRPNEFLFDLPAGRYCAVFVCGTPDNRSPVDMAVEVNGVRERMLNFIPFRVWLPKWVEFSADGGKPVSVKLSGSTKWALNMIAVCPAEEQPQALRAYYWLERDFYNYPVEEAVFKNAKCWVRYPPQKEISLTDAEKKAGFAVINLPSTRYSPMNYAPQEEDSRGPLRTITSAGRRTMAQFGVYGIDEIKDLRVVLETPPGKGIDIQLLQTKYSIGKVGSGSLNQYGFHAVGAWKAESVWLEKERFQPYWLIMDVSHECPPGVHSGKVGIYNGKTKLAEREFRIAVLPFNPKNRRQVNSIYFNSSLNAFGQQSWSASNDREKELVALETRCQTRDIVKHGIDKTHLMGAADLMRKEADGLWHYRPTEQEKLTLRIMKEEGLEEHGNFLAGYDAWGAVLNEGMRSAGLKPIETMSDRYLWKDKLPPAFFDNLTAVIKEHMESRKSMGLIPPAYELWDEPGKINSPALVPFLDAIHKAGARTKQTLTADCFPTLSGKVDIKTYNGIGLGVAGGEAASPEEILEYRQKEKTEYLVYQNSTIMVDDPRIARQGYGYWAWGWNLNGLDPYKYWKIAGDPLMTSSWHPMIFDGDGKLLVTTPSWEAHADGVYDNCLLQELEDLAGADPSKKTEAARQFLNGLKKQSALPFSQVSWPASPLTGEAQTDQFRWPACRYEFLRAHMARMTLDLKGLTVQHKAVCDEVDAVEKEAKLQEESFFRRKRKDMPPSRQGNLIDNGGFEDASRDDKGVPVGFTHWSKQAEVQPDVVHSGKTALSFTPKGLPNDGIRARQVRLIPGKAYTFSAWAKRVARPEDVSPSTGFFNHTFPVDSGKSFVRRLPLWFSAATPSFDWRRFELTFTAENGEASFCPWIYTHDKQGVFYVDDLELRELQD